MKGNLRKMVTENTQPVTYSLPIGESFVALNDFIDKKISLTFTGDWQEEDGQRRLTRIHNIESADLTFMPTTDGRILHLLSTIRRMPELKQSMTTDEFDAFLDTMPAGDLRYFEGAAQYL